jgi:hypothetical protein
LEASGDDRVHTTKTFGLGIALITSLKPPVLPSACFLLLARTPIHRAKAIRRSPTIEPTTAPAMIPVLEARSCSQVEGSIGRAVPVDCVDVVSIISVVVVAVVVSDLSWDLVFVTVTTVVSVVLSAVLVVGSRVARPVSKAKVVSPTSMV